MRELCSKEPKVLHALSLRQHIPDSSPKKTNLVRLRTTVHAYGEREPESGSTSELGCHTSSTPKQFSEFARY